MLRLGELILLSVALFLIGFMSVAFDREIRLNRADTIVLNDQNVYLYENIGLNELIDSLKQSDIKFNEDELRWSAGILKYSSFKAGHYEFPEQTSYTTFLSKLARGLQEPVYVIIPAGVTKDIFIQRVAAQFRFSEHELEQAMFNEHLLTEYDVKEHALIGRMIPNSYEYYWTSSAENFTNRMLRTFDETVTKRYKNRLNEINRTIDEITTMASIIEWEVRHVEEKPRVSGLYWNRIRRNMMLQADPTVSYAIGERRRLLYSDYRYNHPYNTYLFRGLPPGPINNPRLSSIEAALYPENHNYLFMVATPEGYHAFTRTYDEHLRESRKWTTWLREQRLIRQQMEAEARQADNLSM